MKIAGKTTFVLNLASAVLDGGSFLGKPTKKTAVVYLTEQNPASFREAIKRARVLGRRDLTVLFWKDTVAVPWDRVVNAAVKECKKRDARLLVIDTLGQFARLEGESENDAGKALEAMRPLQQAAATGIAVLLVRHERKAGGGVVDSGRGSSAFAGAVDIVLSLRRPEGNHPRNVRLLQAVSRFEGTPDELLIALETDGYRSLGEPGEAAIERDKSDVIAAIPEGKRQATDINALCQATGMSRARLQRRLRQLLDEGAVQRIGKGVKGDPIRYFASS